MSTGSSRRTRKPWARRRSSSKEPTVPEVPEEVPGQSAETSNYRISHGVLSIMVFSSSAFPLTSQQSLCRGVCACVRVCTPAIYGFRRYHSCTASNGRSINCGLKLMNENLWQAYKHRRAHTQYGAAASRDLSSRASITPTTAKKPKYCS